MSRPETPVDVAPPAVFAVSAANRLFACLPALALPLGGAYLVVAMVAAHDYGDLQLPDRK